MTDLTVPTAQRRIDRGAVLRWLQEYGVYAAVLLLLIIDAFSLSHFIEVSNLDVQLYQVTPTLVIALGMALVIGTEGIDLSVGAVVALAAAVIPLYLGYSPYLAIGAAIVAGAFSGLIGGSMVAFGRVQPIVATLSLMIGLRGVAIIFNGAQDKQITDPFFGALGINTFGGIPDMAWIAAAIVLVIAFLVRRTVFGRQLVAIGDNREASRLAGIPVRRVLVTVYVISGILAAIAGVLIVSFDVRAAPSLQGLNMELSAITAVVVGGTPLSGGKVRVLGTVAGAIFMQLVLATLQQHNVDDAYAQIVEAVIICLAVWVARERGTR